MIDYDLNHTISKPDQGFLTHHISCVRQTTQVIKKMKQPSEPKFTWSRKVRFNAQPAHNIMGFNLIREGFNWYTSTDVLELFTFYRANDEYWCTRWSMTISIYSSGLFNSQKSRRVRSRRFSQIWLTLDKLGHNLCVLHNHTAIRVKLSHWIDANYLLE